MKSVDRKESVERKDIVFELKDIDKRKRTAIIAHAAYNNIDRVQDISRKGMFTKSWNENKNNIAFYLNHNDEQAPGRVEDVFEDDEFAYTKAWLGTHTLGNDTLIMMDEGIIKKASFGYITEKSNQITVKDKKVRELKEVWHIETSVLTKMPANDMAGVVSVVKSMEQKDAEQLGFHITVMEKFCRDTQASDECIKAIFSEIQKAKNILLKYNTANTSDEKPVASGNNEETSLIGKLVDDESLYYLTQKHRNKRGD
jgi:HK97 family phage prohead protease